MTWRPYLLSTPSRTAIMGVQEVGLSPWQKMVIRNVARNGAQSPFIQYPPTSMVPEIEDELKVTTGDLLVS